MIAVSDAYGPSTNCVEISRESAITIIIFDFFLINPLSDVFLVSFKFSIDSWKALAHCCDLDNAAFCFGVKPFFFFFRFEETLVFLAKICFFNSSRFMMCLLFIFSVWRSGWVMEHIEETTPFESILFKMDEKREHCESAILKATHWGSRRQRFSHSWVVEVNEESKLPEMMVSWLRAHRSAQEDPDHAHPSARQVNWSEKSQSLTKNEVGATLGNWLVFDFEIDKILALMTSRCT